MGDYEDIDYEDIIEMIYEELNNENEKNALKDIIKENGSEIIAEGKATLEATDKANKQDIGEAIKEIEPQIKDIAKDISELKSALNNPENKK